MSIRTLFFIVLGLSYIVLGFFVWIKHIIGQYPYDQIFSMACIGYGIWRMYRATQLRPFDEP